MDLDNPRFFLKFSGVFRNRPFFKNHRFPEKNTGCFLSKIMGKNDQKLSYKVHTVKCQKWWFFRTPTGALDVVNFGLFLRKILKNRPFLLLTIFAKHYKILHDVFSGKSPIFRKCLGFSRNWPFFKKLVIF